MAKKTRRQKRAPPQSASQTGLEGSASRGSNLQRFTTKAWAATVHAVGRKRDGTAVGDLLGFFHWLGARNVETILQAQPGLPCRPGCSFCCYVGADMPDILPIEALRIAGYLRDRQQDALSRARERLERVRAALQALPATQRAAARFPCTLLEADRCLVYPVRPFRCRAQYSPEAEACRENYLGQRKTMPLLREPALLYKSVETGIRLGLEQLGLQSARLALRRAVITALENPQAFEQWLQGLRVFASAELADDSGEQRSMAQFARRAGRQVAIEERRLQEILAMFQEQPGAWAQYSMQGVDPL